MENFNSIEEVKAYIGEEAKRLAATYNPEMLTEKIENYFEFAITEIIQLATGLTNKWGKWEVDHCNGATSLLREFVMEKSKEHVQSIILQNIHNFKIDKEVLKAVYDEYNKEIKRHLIDSVRCKARRDVDDFVDSLNLDTAFKSESENRQLKSAISRIEE